MKLVNAVFELNLDAMVPEDVNGRACYRVEAKTLPDDVIMNRVYYPAAEIAKGYRTLNNKPAPLGHPRVDGWYVSGSDPEGINRHWCGAWNANVRRVLEKNGKYRIHHNVYIDIETAKQSDNGRRVLKAFEQGKPIHTSTGVLCNAEWAGEEGDKQGYDWIARNISLDHNALLLDEEGAATPNDGVGVFVNQTENEDKRLTINSFRYKEKAHLGKNENDNPKSQGEPMSKESDDKNSETVVGTGTPATPETVTINADELAKTIATTVEAVLNARDEKAAASEKSELVNKVVAVNLLSQETAETLSVSALRELANNAGNKAQAAPVNPAPSNPSSDDGKVTLENMFKGYSINDHLPKPSTVN